ncbi:MAG: ribosomal L7Ae/L30e/S12e/Gadd45 family protein [Acidaminococcales bacterium]|jgi:large subunit ribosomal protein L7A|nr:ribosomal L7Ae/L30e/S12e/Gadd45 family protein [Acidaminococcales bacterium]
MVSADFKAARKVAGVKQVVRAIEKGMAQKVFVAKDADRRVLKPLLELCGENGLAAETVDSMKELGRLCGIQVGAAAVAFLRDR